MLIKDNLPPGSFDNHLIVPGYSDLESRSEADTSWHLTDHVKFNIPVIAANMDTICGEKMAAKMAKLGGLGIIHRYLSLDEYYKLANRWRRNAYTTKYPLALSVGSVLNDAERIKACADNNCGIADIICVDIAHGDSIHMERTLKTIRDMGYSNPVIAGNVVTPEATAALLEWGADIVKVGIGPGSVCTTRIKTGCGYPQLAAIARCAEVGPVIADGGIRSPGDAAKALAAGAKAVMVGGMLAGTDCVPGWDEAMKKYKELSITTESESYWETGKVFPNRPSISYRGMASKEARESFTGEPASNAEGIIRRVECKPEGSTELVVNDIVEGIRSAMSYVGARTLDEFYRKAQLIRVDSTVVMENVPHFTSVS